MRTYGLSIAIFAFGLLQSLGVAQRIEDWDPIRYVDTRIGNGGFGWGVGGDNPSPQYPYGSMRLGPDTDQDDNYYYFTHFGGYCVDDKNIRAFSHTHLVGAGVNDYGNFGIMPIVKIPNAADQVLNHGYRTAFTHDGETAVPGLYEVNLPLVGIRARLTSTGTHGGLHLYHYNLTAPNQPTTRQGILLDVCHSTMPDNKKACAAGNVTMTHIQVDNGSGLPTTSTDPTSTSSAVVIRASLLFKGSLTARAPAGGVLMHFYALVRSFLTTEPIPGTQAAANTSSPVFPTQEQVNNNSALQNATVIARQPQSFGVWKGNSLNTTKSLPISGEVVDNSLGVFIDFGSLSPKDVAAQCSTNPQCHGKVAIATGISWISPRMAELNVLNDFAKLSSTTTDAVESNVAVQHTSDLSTSIPMHLRRGIESLLGSSSHSSPSGLALGSSFHFLTAQKKLQDVWRAKLAKIKIGFTSGANPPRDIKGMSTQFATALYHTMLAPSTFTESGGDYLDSKGHVQQWPYGTDRITGVSTVALTDMSIWDTFRTVHPLFNVIEPHIARDTVRSQMQMAKISGDVERWPLANIMTGCMIGDHILNVIADFADKRVFGVNPGFVPEWYDDRNLITELYPYMRQKATSSTLRKSRTDLEFYTRRGFVSVEADVESPALTLSYALDDHSIAVVAKLLNKTTRPQRSIERMDLPITSPYLSQQGQWETDESDYERFMRQSKNYVTIWDPTSQFMCPRSNIDKPDGSAGLKCPDAWQLALPYIFTNPVYYTEGDAWQWLWFVQQDPEGLVALMGKDAFVSKLTDFIEKSDKWVGGMTIPNPYYWAGNEPDLQAPWMFSFAGRPDLTSKYVRWIVETQYSEKWDGLPGNDDYGALSAWLIWASIGMYPFPATGKYVLSAPLVSEAQITVPSLYSNRTKTVSIRTTNVGSSDSADKLGQYIACAKLNGVALPSAFITHDQLFAESTSEADQIAELTYYTTDTQNIGTWC